MNPIWKLAFISKWVMVYATGFMISTLQRLKTGGQMHNDHIKCEK